ncbi:MAG: sigma-54 dependent transcriptional regulator [bacterium]
MPLSVVVSERESFDEIVERTFPVPGRSRAFHAMLRTIQSLAETDTTALVTGESGAGKELAARLLHRTGARRGGPWLAHNCAALAEGTLESDLFGHAAGSFTGAAGLRRGLFEEADGGTLFLDEVGEIGARVQAQLLRVLQEGEIRRVGESRPRRVDVRVVAATNRDLANEVRRGRFREDLYYRLNVVEVAVPPLRDRRIDIPDFVRHFLGESVRGHEPWMEALTPAALERLLVAPWPGNVRQLRNEILRAAILTRDRGPIGPGTFSADLGDATLRCGSLASRLHAERRRILVETLRDHDWNKTHAARVLGLSRQGLIKMLHRVGVPLEPPEEC